MPDNNTLNRDYQKPHASNSLEHDVARLIATFDAMDADVAALLITVAQKAETSHSHDISGITGLQTALDAKADAGSLVSNLNDLSDVSVGTPSTGQFLRFNGTAFSNAAFDAAYIGSGTVADARLPARLADAEVIQSSKASAQSVAGQFTVGNNMLLDRQSDAAAAYLYMRTDAGQISGTRYQTGTLDRWHVRKDNDGEAGSNTGSNFEIAAYDDAGSLIGKALEITRSNMNVNLAAALFAEGLIMTKAGSMYIDAASAGANSHLWFRDQDSINAAAIYSVDPDGSRVLTIVRYGSGGTPEGYVKVSGNGADDFTFNDVPIHTDTNRGDFDISGHVNGELSDLFSDDIILTPYARFPFTIEELRNTCRSGTVTVKVQINGVDVTGMESTSIGTSEVTMTASAANTVAVGDEVKLVMGSRGGTDEDYTWSLLCNRTG